MFTAERLRAREREGEPAKERERGKDREMEELGPLWTASKLLMDDGKFCEELFWGIAIHSTRSFIKSLDFLTVVSKCARARTYRDVQHAYNESEGWQVT